jgi:hypothetical protein
MPAMLLVLLLLLPPPPMLPMLAMLLTVTNDVTGRITPYGIEALRR